MSAAPVMPLPSGQSTPTLRAVPVRRRTLATIPFAIIIVVILGIGMAGLVVLSNTIQEQATELSRLRVQEEELRFKEAGLSAQVQSMRSSQQLASRAWDLGMRPNPNPAFMTMPDGSISGEPVAVNGNELPGYVPVPPAEPGR